MLSVFCAISGKLDVGKWHLTCQNFCSLEEIFWMFLGEYIGVVPWLITLFLGICLRPFLFINFFRWLWHKTENRALLTDREHQVSTITDRHGQPWSCGSTYRLHNTHKHNTWEALWPQKAVLDVVTGSIWHHGVGMKNTIHKFKTLKSIFSKWLLNIDCVYKNNSICMK